jgi:hypothetical protein
VMRHNEIIEHEIDRMARVSEDYNRRFLKARSAGQDLASVVYEYLEDPDGVGTQKLRQERDKYLSRDAGNFNV